MKAIRILFERDLESRFLHIRDGIAQQHDMTLIEDAEGEGIDLLVAIRKAEPDILVVDPRDGQLPAVFSHIFSEFPHITVLGLGPGLEQAVLWRLRVQVTNISDCSAQGLANVIRAAVRVDSAYA